MYSFDIAVIGGGPGGYTAAEKAARLGKRVVLFEERELGGTCLNRGCIPTKALLRSAEVYHKARNSSDLGVSVRGVELDTRVMHERKSQVVETLRDGVASLMLRNGVTVVPERAIIVAPHLIKTSEQEFEAENIIVATGSVPAIPPIEGIRLSGVYTSDDLLSNDAPSFSSIVIVGGGGSLVWNSPACTVLLALMSPSWRQRIAFSQRLIKRVLNAWAPHLKSVV